MGATTPNIGLYKPGGGSSGLIVPDEVADIDRLNGNFDLIDAFAGTTDSRLDALESSPSTAIVRGSTAARDVAFPPPSTVPAQVSLANSKPVWFNTDTGWLEGYFAVTGSVGLAAKGLSANVPAGWYPVEEGPYQRLQPSATFTTANSTPIRSWDGTTERNGGAAWFTYDNSNGRVTVVKGGRYRILAWTTQDVGSGMSLHQLRRNGAVLVDGPSTALNSNFYTIWAADLTLAVDPGTYFDVYTANGGVTTHRGTSTSVRGEFLVQYIGPALVTD